MDFKPFEMPKGNLVNAAYAIIIVAGLIKIGIWGYAFGQWLALR